MLYFYPHFYMHLNKYETRYLCQVCLKLVALKNKFWKITNGHNMGTEMFSSTFRSCDLNSKILQIHFCKAYRYRTIHMISRPEQHRYLPAWPWSLFEVWPWMCRHLPSRALTKTPPPSPCSRFSLLSHLEAGHLQQTKSADYCLV